MPFYMILVIVACVLVAAKTILLAWNTRSGKVRLFGLSIMGFCCIAIFLASLQSLGAPRSITLEKYQKADTAVVLGARGIEGKAIYLWLQLPGLPEPRYYEMPWSQDVAQALQKAMESLKQGEQLLLDNPFQSPFERTWDNQKPMFYPAPQPKMPDKPEQHKPDQGFSYKQHSI